MQLGAASSTAGRVALGLFVALPFVLADGDHHDHHHGEAAAEHSHDDSDYPMTYFALPDFAGLIYAHIVLMTIAWVFVLPIGEFHLLYTNSFLHRDFRTRTWRRLSPSPVRQTERCPRRTAPQCPSDRPKNAQQTAGGEENCARARMLGESRGAGLASPRDRLISASIWMPKTAKFPVLQG